MERCPSLHEWLDLEDGRMEEAQRQILLAHLNTGCADCAIQRQYVQRVRAALPAANGHRLFSEHRARLRELAAARLQSAPRPTWIALLLSDTRQQTALAGARGDAEATQLRYRVDDYDIRLWAEPSGSALWYVIGQVFPRFGGGPIPPEQVLLLSAGELLQVADAEETEFHLANIPSGSYQLEVRLEEGNIRISDVRLE